MSIDFIRLLVDTGFLILIWAVQLVIYPSFAHYTADNLFRWHRQYTVRVTYIVLPLMLSQLSLALYHMYNLQNWYTVLTLLIIILLWVLTFSVFVPLHQSIDIRQPVDRVCDKLLNLNWLRTALWTLLFFMTLFQVLRN